MNIHKALYISSIFMQFLEQNIIDEIYKISICEKLKNFTNKNYKCCSKINCEKIKNSTKKLKKPAKNRKFYKNLKNCAKKSNILRIIPKKFINFVDAKVELMKLNSDVAYVILYIVLFTFLRFCAHSCLVLLEFL
jgi:hypothetical protein